MLSILTFIISSFCTYWSIAYISNGFYAVTDVDYDGAISDGSTDVFLLGQMRLYSNDMWYSTSSVRECLSLCIKTKCKSFIINRITRTCYATSFDRCSNFSVFLRRIPEYITYEIVPASLQPSTGIKITCNHQCTLTGRCENCGRRYCSGEACQICLKTCWEIPLIIEYTYFWPDLRTVMFTYCNNEWQTFYKTSISYAYPYMLQHPLWLNVIITVSDGTTYNSYFDFFEASGSELTIAISVGNYMGGTAGNDWNAPFTNLMQVYNNDSNCAPFFYEYNNCSIPQLDSIQLQIEQNFTVLKRDYVWTVCGDDFGNNTVVDIELQVTPINGTLFTDSTFLDNLVKIDCTPITTTVTSTSETLTTATTNDITTISDTTTPDITTPDTITQDTTTPDTTTPATTTPDTTTSYTTTPDTTTPDTTTPDTTTPDTTTPDTTTPDTTTPDTTTPDTTTPDTTTPDTTTPDTTTPATITPATTTPDTTTPDTTTPNTATTTPNTTITMQSTTTITPDIATTTPDTTTTSPDTTTTTSVTTIPLVTPTSPGTITTSNTPTTSYTTASEMTTSDSALSDTTATAIQTTFSVTSSTPDPTTA